MVSPHTKIEETIRLIDLHSLQIALVVDEDNRLLGTVTDGDIRRGVLKGISLNQAVSEIMNTAPITVTANENEDNMLKILRRYQIRHLPKLNEAGCIVDLVRLEDLLEATKKEQWVIIMAGGLGSRLKPLTDGCPKPMLTIGEKPLLEIILDHFIEQGFFRFCLSINYKKDQIKEYFGDGSQWGVTINYLEEKFKMGTAGSLSLFDYETTEPVIVMNGDILTKVSFEELLRFHGSHQAAATVAVRSYDLQVPYGVVKVNQEQLTGFEEKPVYTAYINAGIYVFHPRIIKGIPVNTCLDMSQLLEQLLVQQEKVVVFPLREYWLDIGELGDFHRAERDFSEVFQ